MRSALVVAIASAAAGCTTIEIHSGNRVELVQRTGLVWSIEVNASEPILIDRTSIGLDATLNEIVLGFRKSRAVYRPLMSDCHVLIVVDSRSDADEAVKFLSQGLQSKSGSVCILRN